MYTFLPFSPPLFTTLHTTQCHAHISKYTYIPQQMNSKGSSYLHEMYVYSLLNDDSHCWTLTKNELLVLWHKPDSAAGLVFHLTLLGWRHARKKPVLIWSRSPQMYSSRFQRSSWGLHCMSKSHWLEGWSHCRLPGTVRRMTRQSLTEESTKRQSILTREERQASINMQVIYIGQIIYNTYAIRDPQCILWVSYKPFFSFTANGTRSNVK